MNFTYAGQCQYPDHAINLNEYGMQAVIAGKLRIFFAAPKTVFSFAGVFCFAVACFFKVIFLSSKSTDKIEF